MKLVVFLKQLENYENSLAESASNIFPVKEYQGLHIYQFSNNSHQLYIVEIGEQNVVDIQYRNQSLICQFPPFSGYSIAIDRSICLIIVYHWGRGISLRFNDRVPELRVLQSGLNGNWKVISPDGLVAITSGGSDPIIELLKTFFEPNDKNAEKLKKIEANLKKVDNCEIADKQN